MYCDPTEAAKAARLFASLKTQPEDLGLAAGVELAAVIKLGEQTGYGDRFAQLRALNAANAELDRWCTWQKSWS